MKQTLIHTHEDIYMQKQGHGYINKASTGWTVVYEDSLFVFLNLEFTISYTLMENSILSFFKKHFN